VIWYCTGRLMNQETGHVGYNTNSRAKSGVPHRYHQHLRVPRAPGLEVSDLAASIPGLGTGWSGVEMSVSDPTTLHSAITGSLRAGFVLVMIDSGRRWHRTTRRCLPQWSFIRATGLFAIIVTDFICPVLLFSSIARSLDRRGVRNHGWQFHLLPRLDMSAEMRASSSEHRACLGPRIRDGLIVACVGPYALSRSG
jgi:hypothetical protein